MAKNVICLLAYAGVLPFLFATLSLFGLNLFKPIITASQISTYSMLIIAFMAGTHWGLGLNNKKNLWVLLASNIITLTAFYSFITFSLKETILIQVILFAVLLIIDVYLHSHNVTQRWYVKLRMQITLIVIVLLAIFYLVR